MTDKQHIERLRGWKLARTHPGWRGHETDELKDALALLDDYDALIAAAGKVVVTWYADDTENGLKAIADLRALLLKENGR